MKTEGDRLDSGDIGIFETILAGVPSAAIAAGSATAPASCFPWTAAGPCLIQAITTIERFCGKHWPGEASNPTTSGK